MGVLYGAIIATNSTVIRDVEPYTIVGGNPSKEIKKGFDDETFATLLDIKWGDWDIEKITRHTQNLTGVRDNNVI